MNYLIRNGRILDPSVNLDAVLDLRVTDGIVSEIGPSLVPQNEEIIDAQGLWVTPGLIDLHVHFRDPGLTYKETIATGMRAAAAGGFTTVCAMPNTKPVVDSVEVVRYIRSEAAKTPVTDLKIIGAITRGQNGEVLADIQGMAEEGICALSEDGKSVMNADLMKQAMLQAKDLDLPIFDHCEDANLAHGCVSPCDAQKALGLPALDPIAEEVLTARDIQLAGRTGCRLHICHVSTANSAEIIRVAKAHGIPVTAEVAPHHFALDDSEIWKNDANYKMNPPLRSSEDVAAMIVGLQDGTLDAIATDHAPHHENEKNLGLEKSANGIVGLETSVPVSVTALVKTGLLTPLELIDRMSTTPGRILGGKKGTLKVGAPADITLIDADTPWTIDKSKFETMGRNTPFHGWRVYGRVHTTIYNGQIVYQEGKIVL
ncbi:MAG: dihydroorotase [Firmicutes bacterium]|nr:dihydroorotase [Bacillota bacterium]